MKHTEEELRRDGERWRGEIRDTEPALAAYRLQSRQGVHWRDRLSVAAAVAATVAVVGALLVFRDAPEARRSVAKSSTSCSEPFETQSATVTETDDGPAFRIVLRNATSFTCEISAYGPYVQLESASGDVLGGGRSTTLLKLTQDTVSVGPGAYIRLDVAWSSACEVGHVANIHLRAFFGAPSASEDPEAVVQLGVVTPPTCRDPNGSSGILLRIAPPRLVEGSGRSPSRSN